MSAKWPSDMPSFFQPPYSVSSSGVSCRLVDAHGGAEVGEDALDAAVGHRRRPLRRAVRRQRLLGERHAQLAVGADVFLLRRHRGQRTDENERDCSQMSDAHGECLEMDRDYTQTRAIIGAGPRSTAATSSRRSSARDQRRTLPAATAAHAGAHSRRRDSRPCRVRPIRPSNVTPSAAGRSRSCAVPMTVTYSAFA